MKIKHTCIYIIFSIGIALAQPLPTREQTLFEAYDKRRDSLAIQKQLDRVKLRGLYHRALENLAEELRTKGDLDTFLLVEEEMKRTENELSELEKPSEKPEIRKLQGILNSQLRDLEVKEAWEQVALFEKLDQALLLLQQKRLKEGNVEGAKELKARRLEMRQDPEMILAFELAPDQKELSEPEQTQNPASFTMAHAQRLLNGKVTKFNAITREIEVHYDFSKMEQLKDFLLNQKEQIRVKNGQLEIATPPNSDWFHTMTALKSPYLAVPYVEAEKSFIQVEIILLDARENYHVGIGISNLKNQTLLCGPFVAKGFYIEGWTPDNPHSRFDVGQLKFLLPAVLSLDVSSKEIEFEIETDKKKQDVEIDTDGSMSYPGFYPKSWGAQGTTSVYDNLVVRGILKEGFEKGK